MSSDDRRRRFAAPIVCLLPARNAAEDLPAWFRSVERFADLVVALDDGSTDGTLELLQRHPLVRVVLRNPERSDHRDWNDSSNRNRLLAAAAGLAPSWIISIDADELVPEEDGRALRRFIDERAVTGVAYGFPRYRMVGDHRHFDILDTACTIRLFAFRPGQVFPPDRLHFVPVPTTIPRARWLVTDVRIQHLGSLTDGRRQARRRRYAEADPDQLWGEDGDYADIPPGNPKPWRPRRPAQPVVLEAPFAQWDPGTGGLVADAGDLGAPVLSVVLIVAEEDIETMVSLLRAVERHPCGQLVEILVLALGPEVADDLARILPRATVVRLAPRTGSPASRNVGLRLAQGDYVVAFDGPVEMEPGALDALLREHDAGRAVVAVGVRNLALSGPGWASYLDDPLHASFAREPLLCIGGFDDRMGRRTEAEARERLLAEGHEEGKVPEIVVGHRTELRSAGEYLADRADTAQLIRPGPPPAARLWRAVRSGQAEERRAARRVAHLVLAGWAAAWVGYARGGRGR